MKWSFFRRFCLFYRFLLEQILLFQQNIWKINIWLDAEDLRESEYRFQIFVGPLLDDKLAAQKFVTTTCRKKMSSYKHLCS